MNNTFNLWEFLSRDVTFFGGPSSPMLSWLGVCGLLLFFVWHVMKFKNEVSSVQRGYDRLCPILNTLAQERGDVDHDRFALCSEKSDISQRNRQMNPGIRSDCHDLQSLDGKMSQEPLFRRTWAQYRMTLVLEQVPWFMEPRLYSTRRAEEVFTQEALMASRINLPFYRQFPSLVTGLGLLFTFLALFIGLGKLHADGNEIVGIQGLINGLAGKFLTSIVGLMVANIFILIEKPSLSRLMHAHHTFLGLIDQLFPRKTMEQMLEELTSLHAARQDEPAMSAEVRPSSRHEWEMPGLTGSLASLTSSIQALTKLQEESQADMRRTMLDLPHAMGQELQLSLRECTNNIAELTKVVCEILPSKGSRNQESPHHPFLWKSPETHSASSGPNTSWAKTVGPWWPRFFKQRRTG